MVPLVALVLLLTLDSSGAIPPEMATVALIATPVLVLGTFLALFSSLLRRNQCRDCGAKWR